MDILPTNQINYEIFDGCFESKDEIESENENNIYYELPDPLLDASENPSMKFVTVRSAI